MILALSAHEVLAAIITPAELIAAGGSLVLSTTNRLSRVVDRVRVRALETERLPLEREEAQERKQIIDSLLLVREARLAAASTLQEMSFVRSVVAK